MRGFLFHPHHPAELAIARILVFALLAYEARNAHASWYAALPRTWTAPLPGWHWMDALGLVQPRFLRASEYALMATALASAAGLLTRACTIAATLLALYVLGVPNLFLKINHLDHVPVLLALVLAFSPCGTSLSIDRWLGRSRAGAACAPSSKYGLPLRACWLLLGTAYFFPGFWKVYNSAGPWLSGAALRSILWDCRLPPSSASPWLDLSPHPALQAALGIGTVLFELLFIPLILRPGGRWVALAGAYCFHVGVRLSTGIDFYTLLWVLPILVDWSRIAPKLRGLDAPPYGSSNELAGRAALVAAALLVGQVLAGFARFDTWPIAVFPRFDYVNDAPLATHAEIWVRPEGTRARPIDDRPLRELLDGGRYARLLDRMLHEPEQRRRYLSEYASVASRTGLNVRPSDLELWEIVDYRDPSRASENPLRQRRLAVP